LVNKVLEQTRLVVYASIAYWQKRELPLLRRCIDSLLSQDLRPTTELRIVLVDNGCGAEPQLPPDADVRLIRLPENRGFAGGHNVAIREALANKADYVLLFNSDAVADSTCLTALLDAAEAAPTAAFLGPLIVRASDVDRLESAGQSFDTRTGRHRELDRGRLAASVNPTPHHVDAVSGCALLARASALRSIGLLDEQLFAYFEDMDWCLRARHAGFSVLVVPEARVEHVGGGSSASASELSTYYSVRNHMLVAERYGGVLPKLLAFAYQLAYVARSPERRSTAHLRALAEGAWAALSAHPGASRFSASRT
jgi:GT2 family glycosyltransferase